MTCILPRVWHSLAAIRPEDGNTLCDVFFQSAWALP